MREFVFRMRMPEEDPLGTLSRALDELAIWAGEIPDGDCSIALRDKDDGVVGFAQVSTTDVDFRYEKYEKA